MTVKMHTVSIKPMSVNEAWQGRRFKTPQYKSYAHALSMLLPATIALPAGPLQVEYEFGVSNMQADYDNPIKPFQDVLQAKYGFNDSRISQAVVRKVKTAKGQEYIKFAISGAHHE
ncbi:hypothetical protein [Pseudohongiella sp. O18]|uniref:hypothetical protein n=1 Tax=Pseudohongiella sp. O18 TaxID=2904248 RepID=UPI001F35D645|nr:hypothetical protein [Pseudohongiella sp. O18]